MELLVVAYAAGFFALFGTAVRSRRYRLGAVTTMFSMLVLPPFLIGVFIIAYTLMG